MRAITLNKASSAAVIAVGVATMIGGLWTLQATAARPPAAARDILARRPLFGQAWLDLAAEEFRATGTLSDFGRAALARSHELSPNEGQWMIERTLLGLPAWASLTTDLKAGVSADLAGVISYLPDPRPLQLRLVVASMAAADRAELRAQLLSRHVPEARLIGIGF